MTKNNFGQLLKKKGGFLAMVYASLAFQVGLTAFVATYLRQHPNVYDKVHKYFILWVILSFALIIALAFTSSLPYPVRFVILCAFSSVMGLNCIAAASKVSGNLIKASLAATLGIFVVMSLFGLGLASLGINLGFLYFVLFCCLLALLVAFVVMMFVPVPKTVHKAILALGITLFSVFIAYDTNVILQSDYNDSISATINLYLDALNIFTEIIAFDQQ